MAFCPNLQVWRHSLDSAVLLSPPAVHPDSVANNARASPITRQYIQVSPPPLVLVVAYPASGGTGQRYLVDLEKELFRKGPDGT